MLQVLGSSGLSKLSKNYNARMSVETVRFEVRPIFTIAGVPPIITLPLHCQVNVFISVSNGTGRCNFSGQRDRYSYLVPGQRDNGTCSKSCHGTGRDGILTACPVPSRDVPRDKQLSILPRNLQEQVKKAFCYQNLF